MKIYKYLLFLPVLFLLILCSCEKDKPQDVDRPLVFESLLAENDTIIPGGSTNVTATADGDGITYTWSANSGDILGNGSTVTYISPPCIIGNNTITCTVKDKADNTLSKSITITVL